MLAHPDNPANRWRATHPYNTWRTLLLNNGLTPGRKIKNELAVKDSIAVLRRSHVLALAGALLMLSGMTVVLVATRHGLVVSPDSASYLGTAKNFGAGHGVATPFPLYPPGDPVGALLESSGTPRPTPMTIFAPAYSVVLAALHRVLGLSLLTIARLLNVLAMGILLLLFAWAIGVSRAASTLVAGLGSLLLLGAPDMLSLSVNAATDLVELPLLLLAVVLLIRYARRPAWPPLIGAGAAVGIAVLNRYAAAGAVAGAVAAVLLVGPPPARRRVRDAAVLAAVALVPLAVWLARNSARRSTDARRFVRHLRSPAEWKGVLRVMSSWLLPANAPVKLQYFVALAMVGAAVVVLVVRGYRRRDPFRLIVVCMIAGYMVFVVGSASFLDLSTPLDARILAPVHLLLLLGMVGVLARWLAREPRWSRAIALVLCLAVLLSLARGGLWVHRFGPADLEYASPRWLHSELIKDVRRVPDGEPIFTDAGDLLWMRAGRAAFPVPERYDPTTGLRNRRLAQQVSQMAGVLRARHGLIVWASISRPYVDPLRDLERHLRLRIVARTRDGSIYAIA